MLKALALALFTLAAPFALAPAALADDLRGTGDLGLIVEREAGSLLVVDRSVMPRHGHIVVAFVNGERLVKRLHRRAGRVALLAEHPDYPPLEIDEALELVVWGVVVGKFKRLSV